MLTANEITAAQAFWKWFEENHLPFEFIVDMTDAQRKDLMDRAQSLLSAYCEGLHVQFGGKMVTGPDAPKYTVCISAAGKMAYFDQAKSLVAMAPALPNWGYFGLLPPLAKGVKIRFELPGGLLYPEDVWVHLLDTPEDPSFLGLHLALKAFDHCPDEASLAELQSTLIQLVANLLGEESWAMNVQYLQLGPLPPDPMEEGMFQLLDLPERIAAFRRERGEWELESEGGRE